MQKKKTVAKIVLVGVVVVILALGQRVFFNSTRVPEQYEALERTPEIFPDYVDVTIPCNVAPMNFVIREDGKRFVSIFSSGDESFAVSGKKVVIPERNWRRLLENINDGVVEISTFVQTKERSWKRFRSFIMNVSNKPVDSWCVYRSIEPGYESFSKLKLVQRSLETFEERPLICAERVSPRTCVNCHTFQHGEPGSFLFHQRFIKSGTILCQGDEFQKVDLRIGDKEGGCAYPAWRPSGDLVVFSCNNTFQMFHETNPNRIEVLDTYSDLWAYNVKMRKLSPVFVTDDYLETFPTWSPDGRWLYFSRANFKVKGKSTMERYVDATDSIGKVRYGIWRSSFDNATQTFGEPELVLDAPGEGHSALFARIAIDGRRLIYTCADSGTFPIWRREADLHMFDLVSKEDRALDELNSAESESYHSWSSNGDWLMFTSRRDDGLHTRLYFSLIDENGVTTKPFLLPQKDPEVAFYAGRSFNLPEFLTDAVDRTRLRRIAEYADQEAELPNK